ncbi:calcium-dependent lipid-binding (CaLB domain) family protein [Tasmannia lanceolata]|uniref:calcium-dependent lipid-binding (CaLB domain) family protein n=1 Tax=Tasmannia lanceolata TaxID=3420 RepID=UPI004062E1E2
MFIQPASASWNVSQTCWVSPILCPCKIDRTDIRQNYRLNSGSRRVFVGILSGNISSRRWKCRACVRPSDSGGPNLNFELRNTATQSLKAQKLLVVRRLPNESDYGELRQEQITIPSNFTSFQEDPLVDKLRTQLGVIHPIPSPPINRNITGMFVFFFFVGVVFDKVWTSRKRKKSGRDSQLSTWPQVPTSFSLFLEKDLQRKESVEWVNMVLGKLWKVYRGGLENWIIGLLQPVIDNLKKPDYVQRVEIKQFSLGEEPLSVRNVERRTSRRANDLQYQIGLRYTGGARMLLSLSLKFGIIPIVVPVGVRDFDIDGELWVKLRLIPSAPWVGAATWAFVSLPKIKFELSPFRLFNLMAIPVLSMFLKKLLTEDLPRLFVRPKKIVLDFQKGKAVGPVSNDLTSSSIQEGNKDVVGELSVTLVDARKLAYVFYGKTDPYVVLSLGDQVIRSKKNSQTTVIGPPGEPIWNQDFHMLVTNPRKQRLSVQVKESFGFTDFTIGSGEVELGSLKDTVPTDKIIALQGGWGLFRGGSSGEILLRLTYKAYVEDEEEDGIEGESLDNDLSDDESLDSDEADDRYEQNQSDFSVERETESFMDVLAALLVSEEFQGIVASETGNIKSSEEVKNPESTGSIPQGRNAEFIQLDSESSSESPGGSALFWFAVITGLAVLISINVGGSSFFNP